MGDTNGILNPEIIDTTKQFSPVNNDYDDLTTELNDKLTEKAINTKILENIDAGETNSSCSGFISCIKEGEWSVDWEQFDQMTILIILATICVVIFVIVLFVCK